jgi:UDP-N-acetylglucosamine:LPS N-acetylglucosamine transferase
VLSLIVGVVKGFWLVLRHRPLVVLCLGGYAAFAVSMAAIVFRVPVVVTEQNAKASAVNRLIGRFAKVCALPFPGTDLPKGVVTGNPSLAAVVDSVAGGDVESARDELGLPHDRVVIGVFSGSLGATSVNRATRDLAERWADRSDVAIRHVIGRRDWAEFSTPPAPVAAGKLIYQLVEYETEMPKLLVAADLAISRAGASTVAELAIAGLPSVLVPLPIAPRGAQRANAEELVEAGGAIVVVDGELDADRLEAELGPLVDDAERRTQMAEAAATVARPGAADHVARLLLETAHHPLGRKQ